MYTLTLTHDERMAFDWIGHRYTTGDDVSRLLLDCMPEDAEWDAEGDITFRIPGHVAWQINELSEQEDHYWPCFSDELKLKMILFCEGIV